MSMMVSCLDLLSDVLRLDVGLGTQGENITYASSCRGILSRFNGFMHEHTPTKIQPGADQPR